MMQLLMYRNCVAVEYQIIGDTATVKFATEMLPRRRLKGNIRQDDKIFMLSIVTLRQGFLGVLRVFPASIDPELLYTQ